MPEKVKKLSMRQRQILALYAAGYTGPEISAKMYLSLNTIRNYIKSAKKKTGAKSTLQLVAWCVSEEVILVLDEKNIVYKTGK